VASALNNLAQLLQDTNRLSEAEPLMRRALAIWEASLPDHHPNVRGGRRNLQALLAELEQGGGKMDGRVERGQDSKAGRNGNGRRGLFARLFGG
jgi:hypothetical protein